MLELTFGCPLWLRNAAPPNLKPIEGIHNKALRIIADPPPGINNHIIRTALEVVSLINHLNNTAEKFKVYLRKHTNPLLKEVTI